MFFVTTIALLLTLRRISHFSFNNAVYVYLYIVLVIGFAAGKYYSIFMNGTLLMNMLPEVSFKNNEVIRWSSIMVCLYLGLLIPKKRASDSFMFKFFGTVTVMGPKQPLYKEIRKC